MSSYIVVPNVIIFNFVIVSQIERVHVGTRILASNRLVSLIVCQVIPVSVKLSLALCKSPLVVTFNLHNVLKIVKFILIALPRKFLISLHRYCQCTYGQMGRLELKEVILDQSYVQQVRGIDENTRLTDSYGAAVIL